ncbi:class I SAM-dependent methyltransferase [Ktedonosporobacter rubrisoli]|nr:class I SAM-dependent methyltransferase [Ktedonosporobacter rubrisoli]
MTIPTVPQLAYQPQEVESELPTMDLQTYPLLSQREIARLLLQHRLLSELLGGPLPPMLDISRIHQVLDVACGIGCWDHEMALRYPTMQLTGIDKNPASIMQAQAFMNEVRNVTLMVQDILTLDRGPFVPASFDLIHIRFIEADIYFQDFARLVYTLARLGRPESFLVWRESELPLTSGNACDQLEALLLSAMQKAGRAFAPGISLSMGIAAWMRYWMRLAGYRILQEKADFIDISYGRKTHEAFYEQAVAFCEQARPFLLKTGVITAPDYEELFKQVQQEMQEAMFCGVWPIRTLIGVKQA